MKIDAGIPLPPRGKRPAASVPWASLAEEESVALPIPAIHQDAPWKAAARIRTTAWRKGKALNRRFTVRLVTEDEQMLIRIWRLKDGQR